MSGLADVRSTLSRHHDAGPAILIDEVPGGLGCDLALGLADAFPGSAAVEFTRIVGIEIPFFGQGLRFFFWFCRFLLEQVRCC